MAELVDALDSKSCILGCVGSTPTFGTKRGCLLRQPLLFCTSYSMKDSLGK